MNIHLIGNAHLDPAWMWHWHEGFAAFAATCRSALDRISETDGFIFTVSSAVCFEFIEQTDPALFLQIQNAVKAEKWSLAGGWWVEADCNAPSGESFIRQGLYGQSYFKSRFGNYCDTGYCIDSFGHNANLPSLLQSCGMQHYVFMRPEEFEQHLPSSLIRWKSPSDNEVLAYRIPLHYSNHELNITEKINRLPRYELYNAKIPWMIFYGVGNHGGGPTKEEIRQILLLQEKDKQIIFSSPSAYFQEVKQSGIEFPVFEGEFYPHAIGAFSAHSDTKKLNRIAEATLLQAEIWSVISEEVTKVPADWSAIENAWKPVLLNQFHDTLGGVATKEVMTEVMNSYSEAISIASRNKQLALHRIASRIEISRQIETLIAFNSNSFEITQPIEFELWNPQASERGEFLRDVSLRDTNGKDIPTQLIEPSGKIGADRVRCVAIITIPPFGWNAFEIVRDKKTLSTSGLHIDEQMMSNSLCSFGFDEENGELPAFIYTPASVYSDDSDTWGHGITGFRERQGEFTVIKKEIVEQGTIRVCLRITSAYNSSRLIEDFILYEDTPILHHKVRLDWHEKRAVCKLNYAHRLTDPVVRSEIPYASITRIADGNEYPCGRWTFAEDSGKGMGLISPHKTSISYDKEYLSLTVARSAFYAHHEPPHRLSETESVHYLDQGEQEFENFIVLGYPDWKSAKMPHKAQEFCNRPDIHIESGHSGDLPTQFSFGSVSSEALVQVLKRPLNNDRKKSVIARIIESYGNSLNINIAGLTLQKAVLLELKKYELTHIKIMNKGIQTTDGIERNTEKEL